MVGEGKSSKGFIISQYEIEQVKKALETIQNKAQLTTREENLTEKGQGNIEAICKEAFRIDKFLPLT